MWMGGGGGGGGGGQHLLRLYTTGPADSCYIMRFQIRPPIRFLRLVVRAGMFCGCYAKLDAPSRYGLLPPP